MEEKKKPRRYGLLIAAVVVFVAVAGVGLHATSSQEFCVSCHEMKVYAEELRLSPHAKDTDGNPIECGQCHLPPATSINYLPMKGFLGVKDLAVHLVDNPDSLNRAKMQVSARRYMDDGSCLACHEDLYKDAKGEGPVSEIGKLAHDAYLGKNGQAASNCAGCHINLAHLPEFDRRLDVNAEFTSKILQEEALQR